LHGQLLYIDIKSRYSLSGARISVETEVAMVTEV